MPSSICFTKMSGAGNDFLFISLINEKNIAEFRTFFGEKKNSQIAIDLCNRHHSIGADGVAFIIPPDSNEDSYKWDFYNADGSTAEMCGNAARCVALYAHKNKIAPKIHRFSSIAGTIEAEVLSEDLVDVTMTPIQNEKLNQTLTIEDKDWTYHFLDTGVPHAVLPTQNFEINHELHKLAAHFRGHKTFLPQGTNVSFYSEKSPGKISAVSFERGVEDFTLACGTGSVAVAQIYRQLQNYSGPIEVEVPGGLLTIKWIKNRPHLVGPAKFIADCHIYK